MFAEKVEALGFEMFGDRTVMDRDRAHPQRRELAMMRLQCEFDLVDTHAPWSARRRRGVLDDSS